MSKSYILFFLLFSKNNFFEIIQTLVTAKVTANSCLLFLCLQVSCSGFYAQRMRCVGVNIFEASAGMVLADVEAIASIWSRNLARMRKIYDFYAGTMEPDRTGRGLVKKMMGFEELRKFLKEFGVMPRFIDLPALQHIFRGCKLWEWSQAFGLMSASENVSDGGSEMLFTAGNLSISLAGLFELMTRVAVRAKLGNNPIECLRNLLKLMDCSQGKQTLADASRGSIVIKIFDTSIL